MADAPRILFLNLTDDVGSDRIVGELGRAGAACAVLGSTRSFASLSRFTEARFPLPARLGAWISTLVLRRRLTKAIRAWRADRVVPLDELSALVLRTIAADQTAPADVRAVLVHSLGRTAGYGACCHRVALMKVAARLAVRVPAFAEAAHRSASAGLPFPLVVKRDHSSGSGGVAVVRDEVALKSTLRRASLKNAIKRAMAVAAGFRHGETPVLLQQHIDGALAMRTVVCREGVVLDGINFLAVQVHPKKRASTMLQAIAQPEMEEAAQRLVAALGCSGFVSFDFILDPAGQAFLIEMNPRPIGSTHLGRLFGHDLGHCFLASDDDAAPPRAVAPLSPGTVVALFPKELERDPDSPCLARTSPVFHDVPRDEPQVLDAYLRHLADGDPNRIAALRTRLGTSPTLPVATPGWHPSAASDPSF